MKRIIPLILALVLLLSACGRAPAGNGSADLTPEERTERYAAAITAARSDEENEFQTLATPGSTNSEFTLSMLDIDAADMTAYAMSLSAMMVQAYGVAAAMPAEGREQAVRDAFQGFVDQQVRNFTDYLPNQLEIARSARLETLSDGTILLVMCAGQDVIFDSIKAALTE